MKQFTNRKYSPVKNHVIWLYKLPCSSQFFIPIHRPFHAFAAFVELYSFIQSIVH